MINAVLVFNNTGQPRLTKFYSQLKLISEIFTLVAARPASSSSQSTNGQQSQQPQHSDAPALVTYRHYATLYFVMISTSTESPLALLDLIQVFVEALNGLFEDVCELDLIFNFEALHAVLAEMIVGGVVVETNLERITRAVREQQGKVVKRGESAKSSGLGAAAATGLGWWGSTVGIR